MDISFITKAKERELHGVDIEAAATRHYNTTYAAHILGRTGKIDPDSWESYKEKGYAYNAVVGISGAEAAFESHLRGLSGRREIITSDTGKVIQQVWLEEPNPGGNVALTLDITFQTAVEQALERYMGTLEVGEDAGAAVAVVDMSGGVKALSSYPTYNLATFGQDIGLLNRDEAKPMLNRAIQSAYAPGSTFKVGVAVAALENEIIEKDTIINAQGTYTVYEDYQPSCWVVAKGGAHGKISVVEAIQESCNYFFFEVGRLLTIEKINDRMSTFGLGQSTGIELYENKGILAGPDYRDENGLDKWSPGDTLQAAIGQSDNLFTPLQICMYTTTLLNKGVRYSAHLLDRVSVYEGDVLFEAAPAVLEDKPISDEICEIVLEGMKNVMDNGSAARIFAGYPITVGGKTGTAQVYSTKSDNAIMTAFAPYENPDIAVTCVIEQGYSGTKAGYSIKDVFDYYFGLN